MQVKSELIKQDSRVPYRRFSKDGYEHYNIRIFIDADPETLQKITKVEYILHPSFKNRKRVSIARENGFAIKIWTWGMFQIEVIIYFDDRAIDARHHYVQYELPPDNGTNYVEVTT
ncbi:MAG: pYEATS domain-containing protein [Spirulina sp.]